MFHGASRTACLRYLAICLFGASPVLSSKLREQNDPKSEFQQMVPDYNILDLNMGSYNKCAEREQVTWVLLGGALRSMHKHLDHTKDFLTKSTSCYFVAMILRSTTSGPTLGSGAGMAPAQAGNDVNLQAGAVQQFLQPNVAFALAHRSFQSPSGEGMIDTWHASHKLLKLVSTHHQIRHSEQDLVFLSRPDIMYSHGVQFERLHTLVKTGRKFTLIMRHETSTASGCDPTEVWAVTSLGVWDATMNRCNAHASLVATGIKDDPEASTVTTLSVAPPNSPAPPGMTSVWQPCPGYTAFIRGCGHGYRRILAEVTRSVGADVYYVGPTMKAHFHRMAGDFMLSVNRPGDASMSLTSVKPPIDITQQVTCDLTTPSSCSTTAPKTGPKSREGISTMLVEFKCGPQHGRAYICDSPTNLMPPGTSNFATPGTAVPPTLPHGQVLTTARRQNSYAMADANDPDDTMEEYYFKHWYNASMVTPL